MIEVDSNGQAAILTESDEPKVRNDAVMLRWAEVLESDTYAQGTGALRDEQERFCCLGVLCEMAVTEGIIPPAERDTDSYLYYYGEDFDTAFLPYDVRVWAFGTDDVELIDERGGKDSPVQLNDTEHYTFHQIAAAIRRTVKADA